MAACGGGAAETRPPASAPLPDDEPEAPAARRRLRARCRRHPSTSRKARRACKRRTRSARRSCSSKRSPTIRTTRAPQLDLGIAREMQNDAKGAEAAYRRAIEIEPGLAEALNNLGVLLRDRGDLDEAVALLRARGQEQPAFGVGAGQPRPGAGRSRRCGGRRARVSRGDRDRTERGDDAGEPRPVVDRARRRGGRARAATHRARGGVGQSSGAGRDRQRPAPCGRRAGRAASDARRGANRHAADAGDSVASSRSRSARPTIATARSPRSNRRSRSIRSTPPRTTCWRTCWPPPAACPTRASTTSATSRSNPRARKPSKRARRLKLLKAKYAPCLWQRAELRAALVHGRARAGHEDLVALAARSLRLDEPRFAEQPRGRGARFLQLRALEDLADELPAGASTAAAISSARMYSSKLKN